MVQCLRSPGPGSEGSGGCSSLTRGGGTWEKEKALCYGPWWGRPGPLTALA